MTSLIRLFVLICLAFSSTSFAGAWSNSGALKELRIYNGGIQILGRLEGVETSCGSSQFQLLADAFPHKDKVFSMMLSAEISGKEVQLYETGQCDSANRAVVNGIKFLN